MFDFIINGFKLVDIWLFLHEINASHTIKIKDLCYVKFWQIDLKGEERKTSGKDKFFYFFFFCKYTENILIICIHLFVYLSIKLSVIVYLIKKIRNKLSNFISVYFWGTFLYVFYNFFYIFFVSIYFNRLLFLLFVVWIAV